MYKLERLFSSIFGIRENEDSDRYFLSMICFTASVFSAILTLMHIVMKLKIGPVYIAAISSLILLGFYFLIRFGKHIFISKLIFTIFGLVALDLTWYAKFLSLGPVLFFIFAYGAMIIWIWEGKALYFMLALYFSNIILLFFIEYTSDNFAFTYSNLKIRSIDIYLSFIIYSLLMIFVLSRIKKEFIRQKERAIKSDKLKSAFLANMSHEIRTPMNAIIGFSDLLETEDDQEKRLEFIKMIQNSGAGLLELINELIDLSKIEAGDIELNYSFFSLKELFLEMKHSFTLELEKKGKEEIIIEYDMPEKDLMLYTDHLRLKQVLTNLLSNAVKHTSQGSVRFGCEKHNLKFVFWVADTGTGIKEEDQLRIFERFTKFNYEGMNNEGSGIGLSIVQKIINLLNGEIWFESEWGKGTKFSFSIPDLKTEYAKVTKPKSEIKPEDTFKNTNLTFKNKVLVVEDNAESSILLNEILTSMNLSAEIVDDGKKAINYIKNNPTTELVLMDLQLPELDGFEATKVIKKINSSIKIIAQSAYAFNDDEMKAIEAGCDEYITKPIDSNKIKEIISHHLSKQ